MKWILIAIIWTSPDQWTQKEVPGWSSDILCERAAKELEWKHPWSQDRFPKVSATCEVESSQVILPLPK